MPEDGYSRTELEAIGDEWPIRGVLCPHCSLHIPQFTELSEPDRVRILYMRQQSMLAVEELKAATGCPAHWAELWIQHAGRPILDLTVPAPCPYCGMPLRTILAKQCRHCRRDWHDPERMRWLGDRPEDV